MPGAAEDPGHAIAQQRLDEQSCGEHGHGLEWRRLTRRPAIGGDHDEELDDRARDDDPGRDTEASPAPQVERREQDRERSRQGRDGDRCAIGPDPARSRLVGEHPDQQEEGQAPLQVHEVPREVLGGRHQHEPDGQGEPQPAVRARAPQPIAGDERGDAGGDEDGDRVHQQRGERRRDGRGQDGHHPRPDVQVALVRLPQRGQAVEPLEIEDRTVFPQRLRREQRGRVAQDEDQQREREGKGRVEADGGGRDRMRHAITIRRRLVHRDAVVHAGSRSEHPRHRRVPSRQCAGRWRRLAHRQRSCLEARGCLCKQSAVRC